MAGAERNVFEIVTRLNLQQYNPMVICLKGGELVGLLRSKGIEVTDLKLDKITLRFYSITDEGNTENRPYEDIHSKRNPYDFNGLGYSLQLEIITKNKELII